MGRPDPRAGLAVPGLRRCRGTPGGNAQMTVKSAKMPCYVPPTMIHRWGSESSLMTVASLSQHLYDFAVELRRLHCDQIHH